MQPQSLSVSPLAYSGGVGDDYGAVKKRTGSSLSSLELDGCGSGGLSCCVVKQEKEEFVFTAAQFQELYLQVVIFKYINFGLPVPLQLVLPIWKSVVCSLGFAEGGISKDFFGFVRSSSGEFDYRSLMDPEPWRCRRTDGKKWRCYRNVLPDQKYCERHMHRGRRSRKPVEASQVIPKSNTKAINSDNKSSDVSFTNDDKDDCFSVSISTRLDLTIPSCSASRRVPSTDKLGSTSCSYNSNSKCIFNNIVQLDTGTTTSLIGPLAGKSRPKNESNSSDGKDSSFNHMTASKINWSIQRNENFSDASVAPGFGSSPKSVLQGGIGSSLSFNHKPATTETDLLRCRRTDGKKWRCSRNVVTDMNYCENHLHKRTKRAIVEDPKLVIGAPVSFSTCMVGPHGTPKEANDYKSLNTNLSISIAVNPQQLSDKNSSSSSDATTITDEDATANFLSLSP